MPVILNSFGNLTAWLCPFLNSLLFSLLPPSYNIYS
jgi:hypothetical protein